MFLTVDDYRVVCSEADLDIITQSSEDIRRRAERIAMDEVAGYVRSRYDIDMAYAAEGGARNSLLVQVTVDISMYYLSKWLPQYMGSEVRVELYDLAIARLKDIQKGVFSPDLPQYAPDDENAAGAQPMIYGSMKKQSYDY